MESYQAYNICYQENKRKPELEPKILNNPQYSYRYALNIIKRRWLEAEPIILNNPQYAYWYALNIIKGRCLQAEPIIKQSDYFWQLYCKYFNIKKDKVNWKVGL